jgi:hypothetical protein
MANTDMMISDNSITPQLMREEGAMKAYQSVAQSTALAIQDAVDNLRNINIISTTAIGVAMSQMLAQEKTTPWDDIIKSAQEMSSTAAKTFLTIGQNAATILSSFPSGQ